MHGPRRRDGYGVRFESRLIALSSKVEVKRDALETSRDFKWVLPRTEYHCPSMEMRKGVENLQTTHEKNGQSYGIDPMGQTGCGIMSGNERPHG